MMRWILGLLFSLLRKPALRFVENLAGEATVEQPFMKYDTTWMYNDSPVTYLHWLPIGSYLCYKYDLFPRRSV